MLRRLACLLLVISTAFLARADEYDDLRLKWRDTIVGTGYDTADADVISRLGSVASTANSNWSSMDTSPTRTFLWSDAASTTISSHLTTNYSRLRAMALAYATPGCSLAGNATLLADITSALDWMNTNRYNPTKSIYDNWWDFEIGSPLQLTDIAVLLYDQLTPTQLTNFMNAVEKFTPSATTQAPGGTTGTFTGANRMWKIRVVAVRGAVVKSSAKLTAARDAFSNLFVYVTSGDGFYTDGSYIQHTSHPYTAGYGSSLLSNMVPVLAWLSGTTWAVTDPAQSNVFEWVYDSFEPIIYRGAAWDLVRGREAGRSGGSPQPTGHTIMDSIMQMAQFAPPADAARMESMVKEWALSDTVRDFVSLRPLPTLPLAKALLADAGVPRRGELIGHRTFAEMDRVIHLGAGYGFGLSMCSTRIANFESINGENLRGWFTGDGQTILYNADLDEFADAYYATIDQYRMPGVTADVTHNKLPPVPNSIGPRAQGQSTTSPHNWVGGATLGDFGAAGMQFKGVAVTLTGKKSWFMFDDEIVCLGAGITSTDSRPIETTVENRKLSGTGTNVFTVNGVAKPSALGWTESMPGVNWAHLAGTAPGADIGYFFPQTPTLTALREARTGAFADIDDGSSATPITRNFLRMSFEHGSNPTNATYQYVLLPGRTARRVGNYAEAPQVSVLVNNANVQAVSETTLGITAANFWTDTTQSAGIVTANKKCSVLVQNDGTFIDVAVSDPTQANTGSIDLQIAASANALVSADAGVTVTQITPGIAMTVSVNGAQGKTFRARFYVGTPQTTTVTPVADAYVYDAAASVDSNFGTGSTLIVKKSGTGFNRESYLRFDVPAWNGVLVGASLNLMPLSTSTPGVNGVALVSDNSWIESGAGGITWNNKPAANAAVLSTWTPATGVPTSGDVTPAIAGSGLVSFKVYATTQTADGYVTYGSRENGTTGNRPQLVLSLGHTPPTVAITSPADGAYVPHTTTMSISADAQPTDGAVTSVAFYDGATLLGTDTTAPYSVDASLDSGTHLLTAVATDANGLSKTSLVHRLDISYPPTAADAGFMVLKNTPTDIDLRSLVSDADTPLSDLRFTASGAVNGTVTLLADGHTARFTPAPGYTGSATFDYAVIDTTADPRTMLNYRFQSASAADSSGNGRDGTFNIQGTGGTSFTTDAPAALLPQEPQSVILTENGTDGGSRIERVITPAELDLKDADWTFAGWFKRAVAANIDVILHLGDSGGYGSNAMTLAFYGGSTTLDLRNYNGSTQDALISRPNVATGAWHHFAVTRSGTTLSLYVDGAPAGSDTSFAFGFTNTKPVKWGAPGSTSVLDRWLNGSLADLAIFSEALSPADVARLATHPVANVGGQTAGSTVSFDVVTPVESWRFTHFGTTANTGEFADTADKDDDGLRNLVEYGTGTDPNSSNDAPCSVTKTAGGLDFIYTKNKSATDVTLTVVWSDTLLNDWSTAGVSAPMVLSDDGTTQQIKVTVPVPVGVSRRFARLEVTRP
ncbi:MAG: polysaccharide lyase family 8 super-sandwich domain-containing protein [Chthoniobacteraceae bacterium]